MVGVLTSFTRQILLALLLATLGPSVLAQPNTLKLSSQLSAEGRYRFDADASVLDMLTRWSLLSGYQFNYQGRHELPLVPELKTINAYSLREGIEQAMDSYKNYDLDVVLNARVDDEKKQLHLTSTLVARKDKAKLVESKQTLNASDVQFGFAVISTDRSMMQVFVRWATQQGYSAMINGHLVNLNVFPKHPTMYPDYNLINEVTNFKSNNSFKEAVSQFLLLYAGRSLTPFKIIVDDEKKQLVITGLVK